MYSIYLYCLKEDELDVIHELNRLDTILIDLPYKIELLKPVSVSNYSMIGFYVINDTRPQIATYRRFSAFVTNKSITKLIDYIHNALLDLNEYSLYAEVNYNISFTDSTGLTLTEAKDKNNNLYQIDDNWYIQWNIMGIDMDREEDYYMRTILEKDVGLFFKVFRDYYNSKFCDEYV